MKRKKVYLLVEASGVELVEHIKDADEVWIYADEKTPELEQFKDSCRRMGLPTVYRDFQGRTHIQSQKQVVQSPFEMEMEVDD